ncbi:MAG TPA: DUF1385 domain-containing protein [Candidatus Scatomorpha merdavium]|jgi:uncharacterized protein YqhQ|nr:DUF1385 domain-containing protein [Oscillospiraceae bacterium]HIS16573.1 DUF1385 domain-containing protein [Candidatus Scatomorpha merdavium]
MSEKNNENVCFRTMIGGQALIEGIMMRGPDKQAIVCRTKDGLTEKVEPLRLIKDRHPALGWPFIRGLVTFADSMLKGMKALSYSASLLPEDEQEEPTKFDLWLEKKLGSEKAEKAIIGFAAFLGVCLAVALFLFLPTFIAGFIPGVEGHYTLRSLLEGAIKIVIFLVYLWLCSRMKDMKRLFAYHGAEHKTIFCYEKGLPLTVENVRPQSRFHPRCGTSFLLVVIVLGIFVGLLIQIDNTLLRFALRLLLLPVIVCVAYELNRWAGRHDRNIVSRIFTWPGKQLQHLTTNEPDDGMIECAIRALELVIPEEKGKDAW